MIVTCPNCSTHFKVPEAAFGTRGRKVKCARCSHTWLATLEVAHHDDIPLESPPPPAQRRVEMERDEVVERMLADHDMSGDIALAEIDQGGFGGKGEGADDLGDMDEDDPFAEMSDLMRARQPDAMPDIFAPPPKPMPRRPGGIFLWAFVFLILLAAAGVGLYFFQDRILDQFPGLAKYYDDVGARHEDVVGAGLSFRNYSSERSMQDNNEVLVVRGVIANGTEAKHDIPLLRLALYNGQTLLQQKIITPPQPSLEGHATVGFRITLDQPDANATRFEVTFTTPNSSGK
jgi:predicted Zn finger-like uncharacterized protein